MLASLTDATLIYQTKTNKFIELRLHYACFRKEYEWSTNICNGYRASTFITLNINKVMEWMHIYLQSIWVHESSQTYPKI